jgi:hypothetical protein
MGIYKFGNKYLPSVYKTQFEFRSHFSGKKVRLIGQEIRYITPTFGVSKMYQRWETNPKECQMPYPENELGMVTYKIMLVVLYSLTQEETNRY